MEPTTDTLSPARQSIAAATERVADLIASTPDLSIPAQGCEWSLRDVTAHLVVVAGIMTEATAGVPVPFTSLEPTYVRRESERRIADIPETDPVKLSRLLVDAVEGFLEAGADRPGDHPVTFVGGLPFSLAGLAGVYLGEVLLHGYDMAAALGQPWPIDPGDVLIALAGSAPVFSLTVHPELTRGLSAAFEIELRGGGAMTVRFAEGVFGLEEAGAGPVDATISADPVAFLMVGSRRLSRYQAIALGLLSVGGNRPELAIRFPDLFVYP